MSTSVRQIPFGADYGSQEQGSVMLFIAAVIIPVLFLLFSLSLDIARYYVASRYAQGVLDKAVSYGAQYLPYTEAAGAAVDAYLGQHPSLEVTSMSRSITAERIALRYDSAIALPFASYFGAGEGVPLVAFSESQSSPADYLVLLDTSSYLSPELPVGLPWPSATDAADLFSSQVSVLHDQDQDGIPEPIDPTLVTQQCFNPAFSGLKRAAIRTYEFLAASRENAVGVAVFPGISSFADDLRPMQPEPVSEDPSDAAWLSYSGGYLSNDHCAAAAEREVTHAEYQFPATGGALSVWEPDENRPAFITLPDGNGDYLYDSDMDGYLTTKEALWSQVTRGNDQNRPSISHLVDTIATRLIAAPEVQTRGNLTARANKIAVVFAGDLPWHNNQRFISGGVVNQRVQEAISQSLSQLALFSQSYELPIRVYFAIFPHPGNQDSYEEGVQALSQLFDAATDVANENRDRGAQFRLIHAASSQEFVETISAVLAKDRRNAMISR